MAKGTLKIKILGDAVDLEKALNKAHGLVGGFGKLALGAAAGAAGAIGGLAVAGLKSFGELQSGMNEVFTLMPGISADAMSKMTGDLQDFDKEFGVLSDKSVPALYSALSAGVPADNVFDFMATAQKAAVGGVTDLETAVDGITSVVNAFGAETVSATEASDAMFTAVRLGKTTMGELASNISVVTPIASALGVSFDDVMAGVAQLTAAGVPTSVAMNNLGQAFNELGKSGTVASDTFEKIAGQSFKQFIAEGGNVNQAFDLMAQYAAANDLEIVDLFGSIEAGKAVMGLTGDASDDFAEKIAEMGNKAGATDAAYGTMAQGIGFSIDKIKASGQVLIQHLGEKLAPAFQSIADWVQEHMPEIESVFERVFDAIGVAIVFVKDNVIPPLVSALGTIRTWVDDHKEAIAGFFSRVAEVAGNMYHFIVDTVVPLVVKELTSLRDKSSGPMGELSELFGHVGEIAAGVYNFIKDNWGTIGPVLDAAYTLMKVPLDLMIAAFGAVLKAVNGVINAIEFLAGMPTPQQATAGVAGWNTVAPWMTPGATTRPSNTGRGAIRAMASGGIVKARPGGTLALLAERGEDEIVTPVSRAGGDVYHIEVHGSVISENQLLDAVINGIRRRQLVNGSVF